MKHRPIVILAVSFAVVLAAGVALAQVGSFAPSFTELAEESDSARLRWVVPTAGTRSRGSRPHRSRLHQGGSQARTGLRRSRRRLLTSLRNPPKSQSKGNRPTQPLPGCP